MSTSKREPWGRSRKLPSGRWQARYPGPDGQTYTARTAADKPLTFVSKADARTWLAATDTLIARGEWQPPSMLAAQRREEADRERARSVTFSEYAEGWIARIRTEPKKNGKQRAVGTVRSYKSKVDVYLIPEFGDLHRVQRGSAEPTSRGRWRRAQPTPGSFQTLAALVRVPK